MNVSAPSEGNGGWPPSLVASTVVMMMIALVGIAVVAVLPATTELRSRPTTPATEAGAASAPAIDQTEADAPSTA